MIIMKHYTKFSYGMNLKKEEIICLDDIITVSKKEQIVLISFKDKHDDMYEFPSTFEATTVFNKIWELLVKEWK